LTLTNNIYITCTEQFHKELIDHEIQTIYIGSNDPGVGCG